MDLKLLQEAEAALNELPSIYQAIGTTAAVMRRCKPGTKTFKQVDAAYVDLCNRGAEASSRVRMALRFAMAEAAGVPVEKTGRLLPKGKR